MRTIRDISFSNVNQALFVLFFLICPIFFYGGEFNFGASTMRINQMQFFQLGCFAMLILLIENLWIALFIVWAVFLYCYYGFTMGGEYVQNIMLGGLLYYITRRLWGKKDLSWMFKSLLWVAGLNLVWMLGQKFGFGDLIYNNPKGGEIIDPVGLMGIKMAIGMFFAMMVPVAMYFRWWLAIPCFIPIYFSQGSTAVAGGVFAFMYVTWFKSRRWFFTLLIPLILVGGLYVYKDSKAGMMIDRARMWKLVTKDALMHPIVGWGLDSFRTKTMIKPFLYWKNARTGYTERGVERMNADGSGTRTFKGGFANEGDALDPWDNPHNEYIGLFYEFGLPAIILLVVIIWEFYSLFSPTRELIALSAILLVTAIVSIGHFPFHLARTAFIPVIAIAMYHNISNEIEKRRKSCHRKRETPFNLFLQASREYMMKLLPWSIKPKQVPGKRTR